ncbi:MAG: FISUMP domain-containing protein [Bacteroidales bacterium]|jgi:uncharacterized protein (TIGR02145 family)|nr:FISUMP domain-containing protein [Bacteroidales bacterium]
MKNIFLLVFILISTLVDAQNIENVSIKQNDGELIITYSLTSSKDELFNVDLLYNTKGDIWKSAKNIRGEFGDSIMPGKNKKIMLWTDYLDITDNNKVNFKIIAVHDAINKTKSGILKDSENNTYKWIRYNDNRWMISNLKTRIEGANIKNLDQNIVLYSAHAAHNACPDKWELPSDNDWKKLEGNLGMTDSQVKDFGLRKVKLQNFIDSGFELNAIKYNISNYREDSILAFWSSTHNQNYYWNSDKFYARIIKINNNQISKKLLPKANEISIRCIQNAIYKDTLEYNCKHNILSNNLQGNFRDPFTGEKYYWQEFGNTIWLKRNIPGNFTYSQITIKRPYGWRTPNKKEWQELFNSFKPSMDFDDINKTISERMSTKGIWGFNISNSDYWMDINYYTYKTFWINRNDKEDSKKLLKFPSNKGKIINWNEKQTNEKAKLRYILKNKDFKNYYETIKTGTFTDKRDDKRYNWVKIGDVKWMAENLRYITEDDTECKNDNPANCTAFGRMYNFKTAETICPEGWRLPTSDEWNALLETINKDVNKANYDLDKLYPFGKTGFELLLGGETITEGKKSIYTANYWFLDNDEPGYYNFKSNGIITKENSVSKKRDYIYIRCVKK